MRVLLGAYACEPGSGSEPGVGWNWPVQAALHGHTVHVITRANNRDVIETELAARPIAGLTFHFYDLPRAFLWAKRHGGYYGLLAYYYFWQLGIKRLARRLHQEVGPFDLAHHVTFVNDWMPSGVAGLRVPFIWGPVGGSTHVIPKAFKGALAPRERAFEAIRRGTQELLKRFDPFVIATRRSARLILTYTEEALAGIPRRFRAKTRPIVHIGVIEAELPAKRPLSKRDGGFNVLTGGRLVHWKGFDLLIEGFGRIAPANPSIRIDVTGKGSFKATLERLAASSGIEDRVRFLGQLPDRSDVYAALVECDLFALPTLRDGPPVAILEAMLAGKPILCLDFGATRELVPDQAGIKIPVHSRPQVVADLAAALEWAVQHPEDLGKMGQEGRKHALSVHNWARIGDEIDAIYREVAGA